MGAPAADGRAAIFAARLCSVLQFLRRFPLRGGASPRGAAPFAGRLPLRGGFSLQGGSP